MKKFGVLIFAFALILSFGITAFAESMPESGILSTSETSIVIKKEIKAYNPTGSTVNAPSITYTYSIEPGSSGKNIKDANGISVDTVAGPAGATITGSLAWDAETSADQMTTASGGADNFKDITVDFSEVTFPAAGIYRYKISETATYDKTGVVDGNDHTRYLDVYVKNSSTEGQYEIYGYVLFVNNNDIDGTDTAEEGTTVDDAVKTQGFIGENADKYYTYNLIIGKTLTGDDGMKNHQFPFGVAFEGSEEGVLPIISGTAGTTVPAWNTKGTMSSFNIEIPETNEPLKIASGKTVTITGIPVGTSTVINEKNDVVGTTYQAASSGADVNAASKYVPTGDTSNNATVNAQTAGNAVDKTVTFENTLKLISPTGIAFRVAPYALMLAGGIVLLLISRRRKAKAEE